MAYSATSPNVDNYWIGKGIVKFQPDGATGYVDLGNCPEVEWSPTVDKLDHFSSRAGIRVKDLSVVREKSGTVRVVMEELTPDNLGLALMGTVTDVAGPPATATIDIFSLAEIRGALRVISTNDIGARVQYDWPNVSIVPSSSINLISDEWATMEITADVLADSTTGSFGTAQWGITDEVDTTPLAVPPEPLPQAA